MQYIALTAVATWCRYITSPHYNCERVAARVPLNALIFFIVIFKLDLVQHLSGSQIDFELDLI